MNLGESYLLLRLVFSDDVVPPTGHHLLLVIGDDEDPVRHGGLSPNAPRCLAPVEAALSFPGSPYRSPPTPPDPATTAWIEGFHADLRELMHLQPTDVPTYQEAVGALPVVTTTVARAQGWTGRTFAELLEDGTFLRDVTIKDRFGLFQMYMWFNLDRLFASTAPIPRILG